MRIPRIYHPEPLSAGTQTSLAEEAANHVGRVLRMSKGQKLALLMAPIKYLMLILSKAAKISDCAD